MTELTPQELLLLSKTIDEVHTEVQPIDESENIDQSTLRFSGAVWYEKVKSLDVTLAGVGGIGSYVAFLLGRIKPRKIYLFDPDVIEKVNLAGQLFGKKQVGNTKVDTMAEMIADYSDYNNTIAVRGLFESNSPASNIMICGFDNMRARSTFFNSWLNRVISLPEEERHKCLFIDGRLAAEDFQVFAIRGNSDYYIEKYRKEFLFSDEEADETVCSLKQTAFTATMIASIMVNLFVNHTANLSIGYELRPVPFLYTYSAELINTKVE